MVPLRSDQWVEAPQTPPLSADAFNFLNHLRFVAMGCRSKPRADLFEACALLQTTRGATQEAYAEALMRCLGEAVGKPVRLHAPGVTELSFDEAWLVQLGIASARGDAASLSFLLQSRVALPHRRLVAFLIKQISECFDRI